MTKFIPILRKNSLFQGIDEKEIPSLLNCLCARTMNYKKNEYILRSGEHVNCIGMVLSGLALVENEDIWGNRNIISEITPGMIYAESFACLSQLSSEISVVASVDTTVVLLEIKKILTVCTSACGFHTRLIQNLLTIMAVKNVALTKKMDCLSKKTIREKLLCYLSSESSKSSSTTFMIPFNRQELADYLSVDRSALSNEISKLQKEGLITCNKNKFNVKVY